MNIPYKSIKKKFISAAVSLMISACTAVSGLGAGVLAKQESETSEKMYEIGICLSEDSRREHNMAAGFRDALVDNLGASNLTLTEQAVNKTHSASSICEDYTTMGLDMIFTSGEEALGAANDATSTIPIVCTDIIDIKESLHLIPTSDGEWDGKTGMNITGIADAPDAVEQLSIMLETKPHLTAIGILYSPEDSAVIYQNELVEELLDEAGIPWKEYEIAAKSSSSSQRSGAEPVIVVPEYTVAANAKEGANIDVDSFGEDGDLTGINSPNSARTAKTSKNWTSDMNKSGKEPKTDEETIKLACKECNTIFVASGNTYKSQLKTLKKEALKHKIPTFGGDTNIGKYTLTCLYDDPYDEGYRAGLMASEILIDGEDPGDMEISRPDADTRQKLYNASLASKYKKNFPKSFEPLETFLKEYTPGERTERVVSDDQT